MLQHVSDGLKQPLGGVKSWIFGTSVKVCQVLAGGRGVVLGLLLVVLLVLYHTDTLPHTLVTYTQPVSPGNREHNIDTQPVSPGDGKQNSSKVILQEGRVMSKLLFVGKEPVVSANCEQAFPDAIIIGVMKGGTEAFSTFLAIHPQVAMQFEMRSTYFFTSNYDKGFDWYQEQMPCRDQGQVTVDKSPQYWPSKEAPKRIHNFNPNMKLILLVRNPIDRSVSHFLQQNNSNPQRLHGKTFEQNVLTKTGSLDKSSGFIELSTYSVILNNWLQYFKLDQILIIDGDTFRANPVAELARAETFLNISHYIKADHFEVDTSRNVSCIRLGENEPSCLPEGKGRSHPQIDLELHKKLEHYYKPYNEQFYKLIGKNFNW